MSDTRTLTLLRLLFGLFLISHPAFSAAVVTRSQQVLDLTYPYNRQTIYWPTEHGFELQETDQAEHPHAYFYAAFQFCTAEHGGTHLDAPRHFSSKGRTVDQIPVAQFVGNASVIHVEDKVLKNPDYEIQVEDIKAFEKAYRPLSDQDIVLFHTGWGRYWPHKKPYLGTDQFGDVTHLHFPGLSKAAAVYLVAHHVKGVGLDTASLDPGNSTDFWAHRLLLGADIYGIENLAHLEMLPPMGATLIVAPMKIAGGSGGPTRVFAMVPAHTALGALRGHLALHKNGMMNPHRCV